MYLQGTILATLLMAMQAQGQLLQVHLWPFHCWSKSASSSLGPVLLLVISNCLDGTAAVSICQHQSPSRGLLQCLLSARRMHTPDLQLTDTACMCTMELCQLCP